MKNKVNPFFISSTIFVILTIVLIDLFVWNQINKQNVSDIKKSAHRQVESALKFVDIADFESGNNIHLNKSADEIKRITKLRTTFISRNGKVLGDSELSVELVDKMENHLSRPEVQAALRSNVGFVKRKSATLGHDFYYYCEPIKLNGKIVGFIRLALFEADIEADANFAYSLIVYLDLIILLLYLILFAFIKSAINNKIKSVYLSLEQQKRSKKYDSLPEVSFSSLNEIVQLVNQIFENFVEEKSALNKENKHLHKIINSLDQGIAVFHSDGLLSFSNKNFAKILNLSVKFTKDSHAYSILTFPPMLKDIQKFYLKKKSLTREIEYYNDKYLKYKISPFKISDNDTGFIIAVDDDTQLHNLETIRSDFVANVSHEFKTPLTSIRGYSETLLSDSVKDEETKKRFLKKIHSQSLYLENLVLDLLKLNRIESKGIENIEEVNISQVLADLAYEFEIKAKEINIDFEYINSCEKECKVNANVKLIYNIVANLISNSIQYSRENGSVSLTVKSINNNIRIEVKDNGIGVPQKDKQRIFERFFRVGKASSIYAAGSGLGLSIVKNAVELLEGKYGFESEENVGSLFWVELKKITQL